MKLFQTLVITGVFVGACFGQVSPVADQLFPAFRSALNASLANSLAKFFGTAAPGSVTGNLPGDIFVDTTNHKAYICNAPSGTATPACTSVSTAGWLLLNTGGKSAEYTTVSFSATPAFTVASNTVSGFALTLTGNVTSSTISGATAGQVVGFSICQDGTGGRTLVWPASFVGAGTISATASACTQQSFQYDGTNYQARGAAYITGGTGGSITLPGSSSGTTVVQPSAAASGTLTLPAATDTLVGKATTDTLTNKTFDTAGTGNSLSINGVAATANQGTGSVVRANTPTLVTPVLGVATATSINKMAITAPATSSTLAVADGKTLTASNTLTLTGTDSSSIAFGGGGTVTYTVASGTSALGTSAIASGACASVVTTSATGVATTDVIQVGFNGDPTGVTGYTPATTGMLTIIPYPSSNNINIKVCNVTASSITPGAITLNWRVAR